MQNNADSNSDHPLTSNDAVPGDALSINATPTLHPAASQLLGTAMKKTQ